MAGTVCELNLRTLLTEWKRLSASQKRSDFLGCGKRSYSKKSGVKFQINYDFNLKFLQNRVPPLQKDFG
jgi:hypothetical protein